MNFAAVDVGVCAWCGEVIVLATRIGSIYLAGPKWIHKETTDLHCANGKSAAYPIRPTTTY